MRRTILSILVALGLLAERAHAQQPAEPDYPAIVVGSGYGGSVAALHLGARGIETLVLERGRDWTVRDPTRDATFATLETVTAPGGDGRSTWMNTRCVGNVYLALSGRPVPCPTTTGIVEEIDDAPALHHDASPLLQLNGVRATVAAGVGGGSLVNNGVTFAPTKQGWDAAFPPHELPHMQRVWRDLRRRHFARALARLDPAPTPPAILQTDYYAGTRLMTSFAAAAGYREETPYDPGTAIFGQSNAPVIVDWSKVADEIAGRRVPAFILGETYWGNNSGAKKSLDKPEGYLGRALATGHVRVAPLHTVTDLAYDPETDLYRVSVTKTDESYAVLETRTLTTRHLFLAAGSLGTTKLLVRARERGTLPRLNEHVGTRWTTNGDMAHLRFASSTFLHQGGPGGQKLVDMRDAASPVIIEQPPMRVPSFFASDPKLAPFLGALLTIAFGIPSGEGVFSYDPSRDTVVLDWPPDGAKNVYDRATQILTDPAFGGTPYVLPMAQSQRSTFHPLGGVPLGLATDSSCGLHGYRGLYAVDGSVVPGASAVANPALLITALAERCMERVASRIVRESGQGGRLDRSEDEPDDARDEDETNAHEQ